MHNLIVRTEFNGENSIIEPPPYCVALLIETENFCLLLSAQIGIDQIGLHSKANTG